MDSKHSNKKDRNKNYRSSKGQQLMVFPTIMADGPLTTYNENGKAADDLVWVSDTLHPTIKNDKFICKCLWIA